MQEVQHPDFFKTSSTLRHHSIKDTDLLLKKAGVVYMIPCSCGQGYIGETKRLRHKKHQAATRRGETERSAIAEHVRSKQHQPLWDDIIVLNHDTHNTTLLIKETMHIQVVDQRSSLTEIRALAFLIAGSHCFR